MRIIEFRAVNNDYPTADSILYHAQSDTAPFVFKAKFIAKCHCESNDKFPLKIFAEHNASAELNKSISADLYIPKPTDEKSRALLETVNSLRRDEPIWIDAYREYNHKGFIVVVTNIAPVIELNCYPS